MNPTNENTLARKFVFLGALGAKLREMGHKTETPYTVDGYHELFVITVDDKRRKLRVQVWAEPKIQFLVDTSKVAHCKVWDDVNKIAKAVSDEIHQRKEYNRIAKDNQNRDRINREVLREVALKYGIDMTGTRILFNGLRLYANHRGFQVEYAMQFKTEVDFWDFLEKAQKAGLLPSDSTNGPTEKP